MATDLSGIWGTPKQDSAPATSTFASESSSGSTPSLAQIWGKSDSPTNGQSEPEAPQTHVYQDSSQPWYKRGWDWLNTPVTESVFGLPEHREGAGGFERGVENILSGFTSPLSLALTAATFGGGGLVESAGATALKEAGLSAAQIADATKASQVALQATSDLKPVEPVIKQALETAGHDVGLFNRAKEALGPIDLSEQFGSDAAKSALEKQGFSPEEIEHLGQASEIAQKAKAGFTPVEDAVREAGVDPSLWKRAQSVLYDNGLTEHDLLGGNAVERGAFQILRKTIPDIPIGHAVRMAKTANTLMNAGFTYQQLETAAAMSPRFLDALKEGDYDHALEYGTEAAAGAGFGILGTSHALHSAGELFKPVLENTKFRPNDEWLNLERAVKERDAQHAVAEDSATRMDKNIRDLLGHKPAGPFGKSADVSDKEALELATVMHHVVTGGDANKAEAWRKAWSLASGDNAPENALTEKDRALLPDNIDHLIETNNLGSLPDKYKGVILNSLKRVAQGELTDKELEASKRLREEDANNYQIGSANDLLHNWIEDHMTRIYKDTNPAGKVVVSAAKNGKFSTNVSMARHQVYDSHLTALLKSPKEIVMDPVYSVAQGRAAIIRAAANRQLIDQLRDNFTRASDGRPAVVINGAGHVVSGPNGEDPKTFIQPNRVRSLKIADSAVQQMEKSGDLQRFLEDGTVRDITPKVTPQNIQDFINRIQEKAGKTDAKYDEVGNNKLRTDEMMLKSILTNQDWGRLDEFNAAQPKVYAFDPQDYVSLDHPSFKAWKFASNDPSGNPVFVNSDIMAHPEFAQYLKDRLGLEQGAISKSGIGKAALSVGTKLKHTLLSLSPFHMMQIGLRGIMTGVNPFSLAEPDLMHGAKIDPSDPHSPTIMRKLVEHGYTTGTDYKSLQEHSEGVSAGGGPLAKLPGPAGAVGRALNWYQDFLFKRYIPSIKATAAEKMFEDYRREFPDWSVDKIARATAQHANETFGGINWRAMGRNATTQDWGRLLLLAPDWLESELRSGARLFNGQEGAVGRAQVAKMALGLWGIARVLNYITTGNGHYEAPFGLAVKNKDGKEIIYGMRTLPTDLLHAASDPVNFIKGRLSPTVAGMTELITGRDRYGRKLGPQDLWVDTFRNMAPLPLQAVGQALTGGGPEVGNTGQVVKAVGGTAQSYQSPGMKLAAELAAAHTEDGPVDPSQMARHRQVMNIEDQIRRGEVTWPEVYRLAYATDQLKPEEVKRMQNHLKATQGMDADTAKLYTRMARLPAPQFFQVWDLLGPQEKTALLPLTKKTIQRYLNKAAKDLSPRERQQDPTFNRIMHMLPMLAQQAQANHTP